MVSLTPRILIKNRREYPQNLHTNVLAQAPLVQMRLNNEKKHENFNETASFQLIFSENPTAKLRKIIF